jgi:putative ATP-dependent endonuclease of OLD family
VAIIRLVEIENFRSIRKLSWVVAEGLNCLIGAGDSGKSTLLDAIEFALNPRSRATFSDADFYLLEVNRRIQIRVTFGGLEDVLKNFDMYGQFHRGFDPQSGAVHPEPDDGIETVLTAQLAVGSDLEPSWGLFSERAAAEDYSRDFNKDHRKYIVPSRIGAYASHHLAWGQRSVLSRLFEGTANVGPALVAAGRSARESFGKDHDLGVGATLTAVTDVARELGVAVSGAQALLDIQGVSLSGGSVSLHDSRALPLRGLGTGSTRLLVAGMQRMAVEANAPLLIDELEHGLEPYRIVRILHSLGSKDRGKNTQVFMTSHSPVVLRELSAVQVFVVRPSSAQPGNGESDSHTIKRVGDCDDGQATLRSCAEAFLAPSVLVCEGKTEQGFVRGLDLHEVKLGRPSMSALGVYPADGGGKNLVRRALAFAALGYRVGVLCDHDADSPKESEISLLQEKGITVFRWESGCCLEEQLFKALPIESWKKFLEIAVERKGVQRVDSVIKHYSQNQFSLEACLNSPREEMRSSLGKAAKGGEWVKDIDPAEQLGESLAAHCIDAKAPLPAIIGALRQWIVDANVAHAKPPSTSESPLDK